MSVYLFSSASFSVFEIVPKEYRSSSDFSSHFFFLLTWFVRCLFILFCSVLLFLVASGGGGTVGSSIPRSFWFVIVTCTTVGYGDMFPTTNTGKVIATCSFVGGMLVLALPITIIGTNFSEEYRVVEEKKQVSGGVCFPYHEFPSSHQDPSSHEDPLHENTTARGSGARERAAAAAGDGGNHISPAGRRGWEHERFRGVV
jgi:hypothetical protein